MVLREKEMAISRRVEKIYCTVK